LDSIIQDFELQLKHYGNIIHNFVNVFSCLHNLRLNNAHYLIETLLIHKTFVDVKNIKK